MKQPFHIAPTHLLSAVKTWLIRWETLVDLLIISILLIATLQLSLLPPQASPVEITSAQSLSTVTAISENPLYLPYKLIGALGLEISGSIRTLRALSIFVLIASTYALYSILRRWHKRYIAVAATGMFITNATVLIIGRLGTPLVMLMGWLFVIATMLWLRHGTSRHLAPVGVMVAATSLVYIPGAPYFLLLLAAMFSHKIRHDIRHVPLKTRVIGGLLGVIILAPLIVSSVRDIEVLKEWLLLPSDIDVANMWRDILRVPSAFIYRMPVNPTVTPARLPVLDVASGGLLLIGLYTYRHYFRLEKIRIMFVVSIAAIILGALGQVLAAVTILVPFAYTVIASGIEFLLNEWYRVFPRNPIARSVGFILVMTVVSMSCYYQLTKFLVVWPQMPQTRAEYTQSRLLQ